MQGLDWQTWRMKFVAGLNQKTSPRMLAPPALDVALDVQYDTEGDLETRYPYLVTNLDIVGGGTIAGADVRRIEPCGSELLLFTADTLYSWNATMSKWAEKGTHLAVKVDEQPVFVTTGEQTQCDRAELDGLVVYAWHDDDKVYCAAIDKPTGSVVVSPVNLAEGGTGVLSRPRLVALDTVILLFTSDATSGSLHVTPIDPADPVGTIAGASPIGDPAHDEVYDVTRVIGADLAVFVQRCAGNTYSISTVTPDLVELPTPKARACDGPIAVSCSPDGVHAQIVRADGTNIVGDLILLSDLSDVYTAQAIGTAPNTCYQIAAAHRSVQDSAVYRCYVFWANGQSSVPGSSGDSVKYNWVSTGNTLGTQGLFVHTLGLASRAFDYDGRVYVNLVAAPLSDITTAYGDYQFNKATLQNTYFLFRDDAFECGKQAMNRAGGFIDVTTSTGHLPGVAVDEDDGTMFHWCGTERRLVPIGDNPSGAYADRGPRDFTLTFDSDEARRCVRLGQTLYIACGSGLLQYDGSELAEVGFFTVPYSFTLTSGAGGSLANGVYFYKGTARAQNAKGEVDRSTTGAAGGIEITAGPEKVTIYNLSQVYLSHRGRFEIELWRTRVNPAEDVPYYKVTGSDPTDTTGNNCFLFNDAGGTTVNFDDELVDEDVRDRESNNENGGVLENMQPPACSIVVASDDRLFLGGIASDPDRIWYSKQRGDGEIAAFHDNNVVAIPSDGGAITGMGFLGETLVVFRETAVYALAGDGYDNTGGGQNFVTRRIPGNVGAVNHESICEIERGLVFKSSKGWYLVNRGFALEYIGGGVTDYDDHVPLAVHAVESQHQVRILLERPSFEFVGPPAEEEEGGPIDVGGEADPVSRMIVLDTQGGQWFEWTVEDGYHACLWNGSHVYLAVDGPHVQQVSHATTDYGIDVETAWIDLAAMSGFGRVRFFEVHGEFRSAHDVQIRLARDHWADGVDTYFDDETWTATQTVAGQPLELEHGPSIPQVNQLKVRITATPATTGESLKLSYLDFELGFKRGLYRRLPEAQKQ